jgi:hypothetical protein
MFLRIKIRRYSIKIDFESNPVEIIQKNNQTLKFRAAHNLWFQNEESEIMCFLCVEVKKTKKLFWKLFSF